MIYGVYVPYVVNSVNLKFDSFLAMRKRVANVCSFRKIQVHVAGFMTGGEVIQLVKSSTRACQEPNLPYLDFYRRLFQINL